MTRPGTPRALVLVVVVVVLGASLGRLGTASAAAAGWSISISGALDGTAKQVEPQCLVSPTDDGPLISRATFKLGGRRLRVSMYFAAPADPGSRAFGQTPGPSTVVVALSDVSNQSVTWTSATGSGAINDDRRSGTVQGTLVGAGDEVQMDATFACPKPRSSSGDSGADDRSEAAEFAPGFEGTVEATTSGHCTGTETGTLDLFGFVKGKVFGAIFAEGSYTCEGITVPTSGGLLLSGSFKDNTLRLGVDELLGLLLAPPGCLVGGERLTIHVRRGAGSATPAYTAPSGDVYKCTITVQQE